MMALHSFQELKRAKKLSRDGLPTVKVAITGDCSTQHLSMAIEGACVLRGVSATVYDADYDLVSQLLLDSGSDLYAFAPDIILIQLCTEKLYERYLSLGRDDRQQFSSLTLNEVRQLWRAVETNSRARVLQCTFPEIDDRVFGGYALKLPWSFIAQIRKLNVLLADETTSDDRVELLDLCGIASRVGCLRDDRLWYSAKMPLSLDAISEVADITAAGIAAHLGIVKKCVVVDLDGTIWGGVIGDDGLSGIELGELGSGPAFTAMQQWLKELVRRGMILAVCSKNDEAVARSVFENHPDMILSLDDIACFVANWEDKATNISFIQRSLNIGMDSIVFLDDNPFERNLVREMLPQVTVPELPEDPAVRLSYLQGLDLFEAAGWSEEDAERTSQYIAEGKRRATEAEFGSLDDYLESLQMRAVARPFDSWHAPRIAQLTQRSNQFNLRTIRYSEEDILRISRSDNCITRYFTLEDRFGDYGLIAVVILELRDEAEAFIDTLLMSCRVLKRGVEEVVVNCIADAAREAGCTKVVGEYIPTKKNALVRDFYPASGFSRSDDGLFVLDLNRFHGLSSHVQIME